MRFRNRKLGTAIAITSGVVCSVAFLAWLTLEIRHTGLDHGGQLTGIVSGYITIVTFPVTVLGLAVAFKQASGEAAVATPGKDLAVIADTLALAVRDQLDAEERIRRINDPFPLPVRWKGGPVQLMDHWQSINGSLHRRTPISLEGHGDNIADLFARIPSRRIVVLGRAGAGKTIVASRFVLTLLDRRTAGDSDPVPVLLSVGSWDPSAVTLRNWVVEQLVSDYPILGQRDRQGTTFAASLLAARRVMLVLDGFDEISKGLRVDAIRQINAGLGRGDWFMTTSRPEEYAAAVTASDVLTACAVIQLLDLTVRDVADYLPLTVRKEFSGRTRTKWDSTVNQLRHPGGSAAAMALRVVLSTPLMVALARTSYSDTDADPAELLTTTPASGEDLSNLTANLENRLLAGFIPAVYTDYPTDDARESPPSWPVIDVLRWLRFLGAHLDELQTQDLAWWQLNRAVPQLVTVIATSTAVALPIFLIVALGRWTAHWHAAGSTIWTDGGVIFGVLCGLVAAVLAASGRAMRPAPSRMQLRFRGQFRRVLRFLATELSGWRAAAWIGTCVTGGLVFGLIGRFTLGKSSAVLAGPAAGLFIGFGLWFIVALVQGLGVIVDPTETAGPADLLRSDRATGLRQGLIAGAIGTGLILVVLWWFFDHTYHLMSGVLFWPVTWLLVTLAAAGMWVFPGMVWGPWLIARICLPIRGHLPWSIMAFLGDAHRRGILRQAGGVYQFRHARLQHYLAGLELSSLPSRSPGIGAASAAISPPVDKGSD